MVVEEGVIEAGVGVGVGVGVGARARAEGRDEARWAGARG